MTPGPEKNQVDEYFVIRIERQLSEEQPRLAKRDIFLGDENQLVKISQARRYTTADEAAEYIQQLDTSEQYQYIIQFCSSMQPNGDPTEIEILINRIMDIPYPYRRTAYNWIRGRDVLALLRRESEEVCERHRRVLLDHDIDITVKSDVILMKPKRGKLNINTGDNASAPRQYFAYPDQKPIPVSDDEDENTE